ncbi:MAG: hypothetical protein AB7D00_08180 [Rhodospirillaceae bacterium]
MNLLGGEREPGGFGADRAANPGRRRSDHGIKLQRISRNREIQRKSPESRCFPAVAHSGEGGDGEDIFCDKNDRSQFYMKNDCGHIFVKRHDLSAGSGNGGLMPVETVREGARRGAAGNASHVYTVLIKNILCGSP